MKFSTLFSSALAATTACAVQNGFNIDAKRDDGACKATADWQGNFNLMKGLPGTFRYARVYASSDCNTLANAVPAALNTGVKLLVGVWTEDNTHYTNEKNALVAAIRAHGTSWISAVSVGSEDLYRGDTTAAALAGQINQVRGIVRGMGFNGPVGHVDTWTAWVNDGNAAVLKACDFIGFDGYPYFQNASIQNAKSVFDQSITATKQAIQRHKAGTPLWITETGWPIAGPNYGPAVPSAAHARNYWINTWCKYPNAVKYYYTLRDYQTAPANPSFGVIGKNFAQLFNLAC